MVIIAGECYLDLSTPATHPVGGDALPNRLFRFSWPDTLMKSLDHLQHNPGYNDDLTVRNPCGELPYGRRLQLNRTTRITSSLKAQ